jgi:hypothetical protein
MNQKLNICTGILLQCQNKYFKVNNSKLLHTKAVYKHHSDDIKIDISIAIVLHNLNQLYILSQFF